MSEAPSHSSAGSQGSLCPDDSISQIIPQYFTDNSGYRFEMDMEDDGSAPSDILSSAPSDLLTPTIDSNILQSQSSSTRSSRSHQLRNSSLVPSGSFPNDLPSAHLAIPSAFLPRKKARKGHCWFPANGIEVLDKGKWRWKCARCMLLSNSTLLYTQIIKRIIIL